MSLTGVRGQGYNRFEVSVNHVFIVCILNSVPRSSGFDCSPATRSDTPDSNYIVNDNCNNSLRHKQLLRALALNNCSTWQRDDTDDEVRSYFTQHSATSSESASQNNDDDWSMTSVVTSNQEREFFFRPISVEMTTDSDSDVSRSGQYICILDFTKNAFINLSFSD